MTNAKLEAMILLYLGNQFGIYVCSGNINPPNSKQAEFEPKNTAITF